MSLLMTKVKLQNMPDKQQVVFGYIDNQTYCVFLCTSIHCSAFWKINWW